MKKQCFLITLGCLVCFIVWTTVGYNVGYVSAKHETTLTDYENLKVIGCPAYVRVEMPYRLWYGNHDYSFVDIVQSGCEYSYEEDSLVNCRFTDESPITKIMCSQVDDIIHITKENSVWTLFDYTDELNMELLWARTN